MTDPSFTKQREITLQNVLDFKSVTILQILGSEVSDTGMEKPLLCFVSVVVTIVTVYRL